MFYYIRVCELFNDDAYVKSHTDTNVCHSRESGNDNYLLSNLEN
jgi:hypothetical protein